MPTNIHPGDIVLVRFPFTDLSATKVRPAVVLAIHGADLAIAGIFSTSGQDFRETWLVLSEHDPAFPQTGLKTTSMVKGERVAVIERSVVSRKLGSLSAQQLAHVKKAVRLALSLE